MGCSASKALEAEPEPHRGWSVARLSGSGSVRPRKSVSSRVARGSTLRHPKSLLVNVNTHQTSTFADIVRQNRAKSANEEGPNRSHSLGYVDKLKKVIRVYNLYYSKLAPSLPLRALYTSSFSALTCNCLHVRRCLCVPAHAQKGFVSVSA